MIAIVASPRHHPRLILWDALVRQTETVTHDGKITVDHKPPVRRFYLDYDEGDGSRICVWEGVSYAGAIANAHQWRDEDNATPDINDQVSAEGGGY